MFTCTICQREFVSWDNYDAKTCSLPCTKIMMFQRIIDDYSERAGMPIDQWLRQKYTEELWSYRDIIKALGITQVRTLKRLFKHFDIPIRERSEAVKTQWVDNPERKANMSKWAKAHPKLTGDLNPSSRPEVKQKISEAKMGKPSKMPDGWLENVRAAHKRIIMSKADTDIERIMRAALESAHIPFEKQKTIAVYVVDFAIEYNNRTIVVECDGLYWHRLPGKPEKDARKDMVLSDLGWTVLRFTDHNIKKEIDYCLRVIHSALDLNT